MPDLINGESLEGDFDTIFNRSFAPRLGEREAGFRAIFDQVRKPAPTIVETGCLRSLGNWSGDGQSTFMFDLFALKHNGTVISIDTDYNSLVCASSVISSRTRLLQGEGYSTIANNLDPTLSIDLLYLDSFDAYRDVSQIPAPVHYLLELCAARPFLKPGSIIAIDDYSSPGLNGNGIGKGLGVDLFLSAIGATVLHDGYQKVWRL